MSHALHVPEVRLPHVNLKNLATRLGHVPQRGRELLSTIHPRDNRPKLLRWLQEDIEELSTHWTSEERRRIDAYLTDLVCGRDTTESSRHISEQLVQICTRNYRHALRQLGLPRAAA